MTKNQKDTKARHGYQPTWDLQRQKQESMAEGFYDEYESNIEIQEEEQ